MASQTQSKYKLGAFNTGSFLENQDQPRFQSITQDQAVSQVIRHLLTFIDL